MAKKGQAIQLQTEVNNDEEWEKLLQRDGLIVADVYSEWCGPCSGMTATLKKLKLEIGGDVLQLATVKADKITALARFRNKSEPTWMFISNGRMVNFMFGANAPKLTRLITEELKKEKEVKEGRRERTYQEISELADEERERQAAKEDVERAAREKEVAKAEKELLERRTAECHKILESLSHFGIILIFPHARTSYQEAFGDLLGEAGLNINQQEKQVHISDLVLEEILYFSEEHEDDYRREELLSKPSITLLMKRSSENLPNAIDDVVAQMVYGNLRKPPGDPNSPYQKLLLKKDEIEIPGIWTPPNASCKALALKWFFPNISNPFKLPEETPVPSHLIIGYDAFKYKEVMELSKQYPEAVMKYGFFSTDIPGESQLITKTVEKFEKRPAPPTYDEKIVIQLAKSDEWLTEFCELGPSYMSSDTVKGAEDAKAFFPATYDIPEDIILEIKKKPKKKVRGKFVAVVEAHEEQILQIDKEASTEPANESEQQTVDDSGDGPLSSEDKGGDNEGDEEEVGDVDVEGEAEEVDETDKATSPMVEEKEEQLE